MSERQKKGSCQSYTGSRDDIAGLIPCEAQRILDVGCSTGQLGSNLKQRSNHLEVVGIELDEQMAVLAEEKIDRVIVGDVEEVDLEDCSSLGYFDCIIFADVLEHLRDPWEVLKETVEFLADEGIIVASIPNVRHYTTIANLAFGGYWPYRDRGIHDRAHLRFFTLKNIKEMFQGAGLTIARVERKYRIVERPHRCNKISKYLACRPLRDFLTFQYLIRARKPYGDLSPHA